MNELTSGRALLAWLAAEALSAVVSRWHRGSGEQGLVFAPALRLPGCTHSPSVMSPRDSEGEMRETTKSTPLATFFIDPSLPLALCVSRAETPSHQESYVLDSGIGMEKGSSASLNSHCS